MAKNISSKEIEKLYDSGEYRLSQDRNDFLLPQVLDFVKERSWINLKPEYQRRLVWDINKKSLLIESFLMNVPVPAVFLYEYDLNRYEVMDGQQRLNAIVEFYANRFTLKGLQTWSVLNGRTYAECPPKIQRGLDRRRLSANVLYAEQLSEPTPGNDIRRTVFERLNTGGQNLNAQELRNCLYSGSFNQLIIELAGNDLFDEILEIPLYSENISGDHINSDLMEHKLYRRMVDCEIVLRFFAFRRRGKIRGSVRTILDNCMEANRFASPDEIDQFRERFLTRLDLARKIFGDDTFKILQEDGRLELSQPLYDSVMVALDKLFEHRQQLINNKDRLRNSLHEFLFGFIP